MPKVVDHSKRRDELVAATWQVIANEGIEAATVRRIAEVAGCTTGRVTHYFDNKDEVLIAALRRVHVQAGLRMVDRIASHQGIDALRQVVLEALPLDKERRLEWRVWLAFWGRASTNAELVEEHRHRYREWRSLLDTLVRNAVAAGDLATDLEVRVTVDHLAGTIDGLGIQAVLEPNEFPPRRLRAVVDQLLVALG